jgi:lipopolysaccharide/colanic/teichoic acid biosynthesis glycosyltransferase
VYAQTRAGRGGRLFRIFKIRSMHHTRANAADFAWATAGDRRITRVGKVLRALHLDELPQLVNVLRGEMGLVGPRPERPEVIAGKGLADEVPGYALRTLVRPGVTGLAQIQVPADSDVTSVKHKVYYDLYYLAHQSVWLDLRICVGTVLKCFLRAETLRRVLFLPTREQVCEHFLSLLAAPEPDSRVAPVPVA